MRTFSHARRLGDVAARQIQAALDRFGLGRLVDVAPVPSGLGGQNAFVTAESGEYVLRGNPMRPWQFYREALNHRLLHEHGAVTVPWPYLHDPNTDIFGWEYVLMPRLPGVQLSDLEVHRSLGQDAWLQIAESMGETLARVHELTSRFAGEYQPESDSIEPFGLPWHDWVLDRVRVRLERAAMVSARSRPEELAWAWDLVDRHADALRVPFEPGMVLHDYTYSNLVAERSGGRLRITGLFDLYEGYTGDSEVDLSRPTFMFLRHHSVAVARAFLYAYLRHRPPRPGRLGRYVIYMLDDRLMGWNYGEEQGWDRGGITLRPFLEPYITGGLDLLSEYAGE